VLLLNQARTAITAAPMTPAIPMFATLALPAPLEEVAALDAELVLDPEEVVAGFVAVAAGTVAAGVVVPAWLLTAALLLLLLLPAAELADPDDDDDAADEEPALLEAPMQVVVPGLIVKAADCAMAPVLSRRVKPMEVPAAKLVLHVYEVPVCWPRSCRAAEPGELPGRMLRK